MAQGNRETAYGVEPEPPQDTNRISCTAPTKGGVGEYRA